MYYVRSRLEDKKLHIIENIFLVIFQNLLRHLVRKRTSSKDGHFFDGHYFPSKSNDHFTLVSSIHFEWNISYCLFH